MSILFDRYAGDEAWREWFDICSVNGCSPANRERLRVEIESALYAQLARQGLSRETADGEDPISFFDSYFKLKGSREKGKPLKLYFAHRIRVERLRMIDFVCGTLFGSQRGRIHDIVIDWISSLKGWKARIVRNEEGCRRLIWETAGEPDIMAEVPVDVDPVAGMDVEVIGLEVSNLLADLAAKFRVEKANVALLLYVTAQDISITEEAVLKALGTGKSMAYRLRDRIMTEMGKRLARLEGSDDPLFGRMLLEACEAALDETTRQALGGCG